MTTIHSYTGDQRTVDQTHNDLRRARAAAESLIPTSTGAAKALSLVLPQLAGKLDGTAIRVPTPNVSIDFKFVSKKNTSVKKINSFVVKASKSKNLENILTINDLPLVSIDFNLYASSSIFDTTQTQRVVKNKFCRVLSWYDNEWGFSNRMIETMLDFRKFI